MIKGDYRELTIEIADDVQDGNGDEGRGIRIYLWQQGDPGDLDLGCKIELPRAEDRGDIPPIWDLIESFLELAGIHRI